ncbi:hypothetical protein B5F34_01295 [Mediterranea sp. An20]|uniref:hypothetical protein n=1 Tax=Mediterranea sp. An20 TaxID=1965586 RepID=UPI000B391831|nr:hypothetical protein [Mediterranea sp. An20]OUP12270.1 hypothetical protein B5F34_01295 [Mediterranea sp. An20]
MKAAWGIPCCVVKERGEHGITQPAFEEAKPTFEKVKPAFEKAKPAFEKAKPAFEKAKPAFERRNFVALRLSV